MSLPSLAPNLEIQLQDMQNKETEELSPIGRSFVFDFTKNEFVFADGRNVETSQLKALEQWIELCLRTYKDKFNIYKGEEFGCNIEDLLGMKLSPFVKAELDREIKESLKKNIQIQDIFDIIYTQKSGTILIEANIELKDKTLLKVVV